MVIDTSVLVAILLGEPEAEPFALAIAGDPKRLISTLTALETVIVIEAKKGDFGGRELDLLLHQARTEIMPLTADLLEIARLARREYGKGRHPTGLTIGDCCSYALAKFSGKPLLFKGSGSNLNPAWGFIYNSGVPFGPNFDELMGFLYGKSINNGTASGFEYLQHILDKTGKNVVAFPIVGNSEQGSGYFMLPVGDVARTVGIGLAGLCKQNWTLRYLPPARYVIDQACDNLVTAGVIPKKNIRFITALAGSGSLISAVIDGQIQGFEFATPASNEIA